MPCSLVLGVNGQDGSYLAESLIARGHQVVGVGRNQASRYITSSAQFRYVDLDVTDHAALKRLVEEVAPDFCFHFVAVHGSAGFEYEPLVAEMFATNVVALHVLLEYGRLAKKPVRVVYAGSSKIFPAPLIGTIDETTPARSTCLYSIGKIASRDLIGHYRKQHGVAATNLILFNHESPRRPPDFLLPKIARGIAEARRNPDSRLNVRTLDFWIDWGAADEFADLAVDIALKSEEGEFVMASGVTHHARAVVYELFGQYGLDGERFVVETLAPQDPGPAYQVSLARMEQAIGRTPVKTVADIVSDMLQAHDKQLSGGVI